MKIGIHNQNIIILAKQLNLTQLQFQIMLIVLFFLCWSVASLEFHFDKQFPLCCMKDIAAITLLQNGGIVVEAANPSVTILNGDNFANKVAQLQADSSITKILVTSDGGVYFGNRERIMHKITQNQTNIIFSESTLWSNMILTDKYALVGQKNGLPILKKLDLQKLKVETYTFQPGEKNFDFQICLSDLTNGQIIFGERYTVYLLNNETFQVEQTFVESEPYTGTDFKSIDSFWTPQESVILIQGDQQKYETYRYNHESKKFEFFNRFYSLATPLTLTSPNTAVSIYRGKLLYWEDFDQQIVARSWDQSEYIGIESVIALSNSQVLFAMSTSGASEKNIQFMTLTPENILIVNFTVQKSAGRIVQAKFTDDDGYLIYSQKNRDSKDFRLYKYDIVNKEETLMMDGDQPLNELAFLLKGDRLIVLMNRTTAEKQTFSYVQLRDIATFSLISQLEVKFGKIPYGFKLLGNNYWNSNFILLIQTQEYSTEQSLAFKFKVTGDQVEQILSDIQSLHFENSFACNKYLISIAISKDIQVYIAQTMNLIKNIPNDFRYDTFFSEGDILVAEYYSRSGSTIYDFSQGIDNFEKGLFFRQYFISSTNYYTRVLFPKRELYLFCNDGPFGTNYPIKLIYDLKKIPVRKMSPLPVSQITTSVIMPFTTNGLCLWVFIVSEMKLLKYNDCDPSNPQIVSDIPINNPKIFISNSQKYLLIVYNCYPISYYEYTVEVRLTTNIQVLVNKFVIKEYRQSLQSIDITKDQKMIVHLFNHILVFNLEQQQNKASFNIEQIDLFHVSNDIIAIAGKSLSDPSINILVAKKITDSSPLLSLSLASLPKMVKLSPTATRIAVYDSGSKLSVWDIKSQAIIIQSTFEAVLDIKFLNDANMLLQFASNISIISLDSLQEIKKNIISLTFTRITVNSDGNLIAALVNPTNVKIFDTSMNEIANFIAPAGSNIVDVGFSPINEVYAVNSNGTLFVLSPTSCPATFINVDSICICPQNSTNTAGACQCNSGFIQHGNQCICDFTYANGQCFQCSFMCSTCNSADTFDCAQYSAGFYIGIVGVCVLGLALITAIACIVKRRRNKLSTLETNLTDNKDNESNHQSSLSEQLYNGKSNK